MTCLFTGNYEFENIDLTNSIIEGADVVFTGSPTLHNTTINVCTFEADNIILESDAEWFLNVNDTATVTNCNVSNCNASGGVLIVSNSSHDLNGNHNWLFNAIVVLPEQLYATLTVAPKFYATLTVGK
jgi:hypothetical protein